MSTPKHVVPLNPDNGETRPGAPPLTVPSLRGPNTAMARCRDRGDDSPKHEGVWRVLANRDVPVANTDLDHHQQEDHGTLRGGPKRATPSRTTHEKKKKKKKKVKELAFLSSGVVRGATSLHETAATDLGGPAGCSSRPPRPTSLPTSPRHLDPHRHHLLHRRRPPPPSPQRQCPTSLLHYRATSHTSSSHRRRLRRCLLYLLNA